MSTSDDDPDDPTTESEHEFTFQRATDEGENEITAIITAVAEVTDKPANDLRPLGRVIDTDALAELLRSGRQHDFYRSSREQGRDRYRIEFEYEGCLITVRPDRFTVAPV